MISEIIITNGEETFLKKYFKMSNKENCSSSYITKRILN